ncbi:MAG: bifunctional riboflavin kinase/FAD synthetase [Lachnospiraceae bacterium]|nr:bifunctional riboflavin kinase/FAD synthetase [Lachnospiraceae bacterium]
MQIIENDAAFQLDKPSAVAIGKFDGIHRGHQSLLQRVLEQKEKGLQAVVFTFDPSPAALFSGEDIPELTTKREKRKLFGDMGIDVLIEFPLNFTTAATEPEEFVEKILAEQMKTAYIAAGEDLSFGKKGRGDAALLRRMAGRFGYRTEIIEKVCLEGVEISSSYVREVIRIGDMEKAERLIGEAYSVCGVVAHGKKLGRRLGMPTVNLLPEKEKLLPPYGVYFSEVSVGERVYKGTTNIGCKPTVNDEMQAGVETYLYDFAQDIYGREITVRLFSFHRPEKKFDSVEALKKQMASDIAQGRYYVHRK